MFTLKGNEFSNLINREFVKEFSVHEASGFLTDRFDCKSKNFRDENFDILFLSSDFHEDVKVEQLQDTTHVSLHFQMSGSSDADISGFKPGMKMGAGQFNLINCVDPVSTFIFPKQNNYQYICVGLKPDFFNSVLLECGSEYDTILKLSENENSFSLYKTNRATNYLQLNTLHHIQSPDIADSLKIHYLRSKVKELILLTLSGYQVKTSFDKVVINKIDQERLYGLKEFLSTDYLTSLSLEGLSKRFLLNEFKLKAGFKELFGTTVFKYIQTLRLDFAHELLLKNRLPIGEVAAIIGYDSDAAFVRAFKGKFGCSPGKVKRY
ncbi:helix-turn-helix domain-containing protein [Dyadobacter frigoris]|uniref:Helix-turn-helix transcriptional regulator n=1 Tax=Dyadobacter frigoris TaxID=2576211 RepID=A0A4U6D2R2_9BACT|nr:AraC family transcriptional regulator [Dyadobacter frigoris]TKT88154.1 helix-turn-helix transcriptional regulator [Dyadobacter frigoris]GLU53770.1 AraC family transcriptional regulator [Dyadobacter frigoris]